MMFYFVKGCRSITASLGRFRGLRRQTFKIYLPVSPSLNKLFKNIYFGPLGMIVMNSSPLNSLLSELKSVTDIYVPRPLLQSNNPINHETNGFLDTSESSYATLAYLRCINSEREERII
ncbi:hypothetical protein J6590_073495 [Homalodisca vitripennis]|nr:hypothetical protein J6590_073495 [Homalodisca vitripennis]